MLVRCAIFALAATVVFLSPANAGCSEQVWVKVNVEGIGPTEVKFNDGQRLAPTMQSKKYSVLVFSRDRFDRENPDKTFVKLPDGATYRIGRVDGLPKCPFPSQGTKVTKNALKKSHQLNVPAAMQVSAETAGF